MVKLADTSASQLLGMLDTYPWFAAARAALYRRTMSDAGREAAEGVLRDALPHLPYNSIPVMDFMKMDLGMFKDESLNAANPAAGAYKRRVMVAGMDYFSKEEYESAKFDIDSRISSIAVVDYSTEAPQPLKHEEPQYEFVTETLAQIYADQGYIDEAISIYTKLSLQSPEKNAYFASLIDKLKN